VSAVAGPREMGLSQRETLGHTLVELADANDRVVVLDGDLGTSTRTDIFAAVHPARFLQMGIAEQNMVGVAAGLATLGWIPFVTTFACFAVCRALDPIRVLVAQPSLDVKIAGGYSGLLTGMTGKTHQVVDDVAVMRAMPHMTVIAPGDEDEARAAIRASAELRGPVYLRLTRDPSPHLFSSDYRFELGRTHLLRDGGDVGLISTGPQTARALQAAESLAADGIEAAVLHVPTIKPLDEDAIVGLASRVPRVVTTEDHTVIGGLGGAVAEVLSRRHPVPILRHGIADTFGESAPNEGLLEKYRLSARWLADAVRQFVAERP
jgi:transketolase